MSSRFLRSLPLLGYLCFLPFAFPVPQKPPAEWSDFELATELARPVSLQNNKGLSVSGFITELNNENITIESPADGGSVAYSFAKDDVLRLDFPGESLKSYALDLLDAGSPKRALLIIDQLYAQRASAFFYLPESDPIFFAKTIPSYRLQQRQADALNRALALQPYIQDPESSFLIRSEILLAYYNLNAPQSARPLALQWINDQPRQSVSALGWYVLSGLQLSDHSYDQAFFTALHPVVFSGPQPIPFLDACYAHAITAAVHLDRLDQARQLFTEMNQRHLSWPPQLPPFDFNLISENLDNQPLK